MNNNVTIHDHCSARCFHAFMHENPETYKQNPIAEGNFNGFLFVTVKVLNSYTIIKNSGRETTENKLKLKLMNAMGFITFFPWNDADYKHFIEEQQLQITYSTVIKWADFPETFVVCKNIDCDEVVNDESSER